MEYKIVTYVGTRDFYSKKSRYKILPQARGGRLHWDGSCAAILRVLQRQSCGTDWSAPQQLALGLELEVPGNTKGAHTLRLLSSVVQLCAWAVRVCTASAMTKKSSAAWVLRETRDLEAAITLFSFKHFVFLNTLYFEEVVFYFCGDEVHFIVGVEW